MTEFSGHLSLVAEAGANGETVLSRQSFRAPFHLSKPYWDGHALIVQVVNPTAGILSGDRLRSDITVGSGAAVLLTSPSASRVFQMKEGEAVFAQRFEVAAGGWLETMPEPLVLHRGSRYRQTTDIEVAAGGELFFSELLMPGRLARGESWAWDALRIEVSLHGGGEWLLRERLQQSGEELRSLAALAGAGEGACFANVVMLSPRLREAGEWKARVQSLHGGGVWLGLSQLRGEQGGWSVKMIAPDNIGLKRALKELRCLMSDVLPRLRSDPRKL